MGCNGIPCVLAALLAGEALGQDAARREGYGEPQAAPRPRITQRAARPLSPAGFESVQVNVDGQGNDIVNDAANEPSIAVDPTAPNRIVIGWRQFDDIQSNFRQAGWAWSNDGGRHWHFEGVLEPGTFGSDPTLDTDSRGNFYYMSLHGDFSTHLFKSDDGGKSWGAPVYAVGGDKEWITIDKSGGIGDGNIYQCWTTEVGNRSTDGGQSFGSLFSYRAGHWGTLAVGPDGEVYAASDSEVSRSDDAQNPAVSQPTFVPVGINLGGGLIYGGEPNPGGILGQVWVDVDRSSGPTRGNVYIVAPVSDGTGACDARFIRSVDGGKTWSKAVDITGESDGVKAWQWHATMAVAPNGRIDVVWNDTSIGDQPNWSELRYASSSDAGDTWSEPVALSPAWDSWVGWPSQQKIGDYYGMRSDLVGADLAWAATFTGGQDVYFLRIGDYDCNGNGIGDAEDLVTGAAKDCNGNGIPDSCEIEAGAEADANGDGVPDSCQCYADFNFDGAVDLFDFLAFINEFDIENPRTDCDQDGAFTLFDFLCFVNAFNAGC